jgi:hypothetical protein
MSESSMNLEDWMDELQDEVFFRYGRDAYVEVSFHPFKWELMHEEGLTVDQAIDREFGE